MVAGCGAGDPPSGEAPDLTGTWKLEAGDLDEQAIPIVDGVRTTLQFSEEDMSGRAACNSYGTSYHIAGDRLQVSDEISMTAAGCHGEELALETAYLRALPLVGRAQLDGDRLVLDGPGVELQFVLLPPADPGEFVGIEWVLDELVADGVTTAPDGEPATLLYRNDGSYEATTGCRRLVGRWVVGGDSIGSSAMDLFGECPPGLSVQDSHVVGVLGNFIPDVSDGAFRLRGEGDLELVYRAADDSD